MIFRRLCLAAFIALLGGTLSADDAYEVRMVLLSAPTNISPDELLMSRNSLIISPENLKIWEANNRLRPSMDQTEDELIGFEDAAPTPPLFREETTTDQVEQPLHKRTLAADDYWHQLRLQQDIRLLAAPKLVVPSGTRGRMELQSEVTFDYLKPSAEGRYIGAQSPPKKLGIDLEVSVTPGATEDLVVIDPFSMSLTTMDGREKLPGLDIAAGAPIFSRHKIETVLRMKLEETQMVPFPNVGDKFTVLLIRVMKAKKPLPSSEGEQ